MGITQEDIERLCHEVSAFSKKANLQFKSLPIITWEFVDPFEFNLTYRILKEGLRFTRPQERVNNYGIEFDCHNVTFKLILKRHV